jgi:hypothetical protein
MINQLPTYKEIQKWVAENYGFVPETCWIAHCKEMHGLPVRIAGNRGRAGRVKPCPREKVRGITAAFRHFGMLP